jgi:hypothetical protein
MLKGYEDSEQIAKIWIIILICFIEKVMANIFDIMYNVTKSDGAVNSNLLLIFDMI